MERAQSRRSGHNGGMSVWYSRPEDTSFAGLRAGWRLTIFLCLAVGVPAVLSAIALALAHGQARAGTPAVGVLSPLLAAVGEGAPFLWVLFVSWIMARLEHRSLADYGLPWRRAFQGNFWAGALWGAVSLTALLLLIMVSGDFSFGHLILHGAAIETYGLEWALAFVLVGFFEEFTFRGYALATLTQGTTFWTAAIILSVVFGAVHLGNTGESWIGALSAGLIGLFFCFTLRRTGSLWFAIGMHAAWDYCESFVYGVPDSGQVSQGRLLRPDFHGSHWITGGSVGPEGSLWVFVIIVLLFALFADLYPAREAATPSPESTASSAA